MSTRTDYSIVGGGGKGYINVGGWNTTLTDKSTSQKEVPGIKRREGGNVYIYGLQGANSAAASGVFMQLAAPATDLYTDAVVCPIVFTAIGAGTAIHHLWKSITVATCDTNTYGWYFIEGVTTLSVGVGSTGVTVELPLIISPTAANEVIGGATVSGQGIALTTIAAGASGQVYVKLM